MAKNRIVPYLYTKITNTDDPVIKLNLSGNVVIIQPVKTITGRSDNELAIINTTPNNLGYALCKKIGDGENSKLELIPISAPYNEMFLEYRLFNKIYSDFKTFTEKVESNRKLDTNISLESYGE